VKLWVKIALAAGALLACLGAALLGGVYWWFSEEESPWSSESAEARAELDAGYRDFEKAYYADAALHFERARELDPKSAAALVFLGFTTSESESQRADFVKQIDALDRGRFTDVERFMVRLFKAGKQDFEERQAAVEDYLSRHPDEAFARSMRCDLLWDRKQWDDAEACYRALLAEQPQWVQAQDRLGLLVMSRGRFAEAEDHFVTYRYIAPNQAGPHYSLGILYLLSGRYQESEAAFTRALETKSDFCPALSGLTHLYTVWGKYPQALEAIGRTEAQAACRILVQGGFTCSRRIFNAYLQNDLAKAVAADAACAPPPMGYSLGKHQLAVWQGDFAKAAAMEEAIGREAGSDPAKQQIPFLSGFWHYFRGVRLIFEDRFGEAAEEFKLAEGELRYWTGDNAILAFVNNVHWVYALELAGRDQEAQALRRQISAINPHLFDTFKIPVLEAKLAARRN
jgi:tetratricopeptide (TPR) repeat protein